MSEPFKKKGKKREISASHAETACPNRKRTQNDRSPEDCGAASFANVPAFICAKIFAGDVSFPCCCCCWGRPVCIPPPLNDGGWPKPGLKPVGAADVVSSLAKG